MKPLMYIVIKSVGLYFDVDLIPVLTASQVFFFKLKTKLK